MLVMMVVIVHVVMVIVMMVVMHLWTMVKVCCCVLNLLIPSQVLEARLPKSCQNSNMSLAGMTDLQECHGCSWLQPLQIYLVSTVLVLL